MDLRRSLRGGKRGVAIGLMPLLAWLSSGCATYSRNRAADFADVFGVELTRGPGVHLHVQATDYLGTGVGMSQQSGPALHGRYAGTVSRTSGGSIIINASMVTLEDTYMRPLFSGSPDYDDFLIERLSIYDNSRVTFFFFFPSDFAWSGDGALYLESARKRWWRLLDVSVGASLGIGFHLYVSPGELLDFALGLAAIDLVGDDRGADSPSSAAPPRAAAARTGSSSTDRHPPDR